MSDLITELDQSPIEYEKWLIMLGSDSAPHGHFEPIDIIACPDGRLRPYLEQRAAEYAEHGLDDHEREAGHTVEFAMAPTEHPGVLSDKVECKLSWRNGGYMVWRAVPMTMEVVA